MKSARYTYSRIQHFGLFIYTPYPSPIMDPLLKEFNPPNSLEEWGEVDVYRFKPPWYSKKQIRKLHTISAASPLAFYPKDRLRNEILFPRWIYGLKPD